MESFIDSAIKLAYGNDFKPYIEKRIAGIQSLSGTGAIRIGLDFVKKFSQANKMNVKAYIPDFTWPNHNNILDEIGFDKKKFRYFNP